MLIHWEDKTYDFNAERDLDVSMLRHIKRWYPELNGITRLMGDYQMGGPDGLACLLWVLKKLNGEPCAEPHALNFNASEFYKALDDAWAIEVAEKAQALLDAEPDPTQSSGRPSEPEAPSSTETSKKSAPPTSGSLPTSATSDLKLSTD